MHIRIIHIPVADALKSSWKDDDGTIREDMLVQEFPVGSLFLARALEVVACEFLTKSPIDT
jgi:hypothetical protein